MNRVDYIIIAAMIWLAVSTAVLIGLSVANGAIPALLFGFIGATHLAIYAAMLVGIVIEVAGTRKSPVRTDAY